MDEDTYHNTFNNVDFWEDEYDYHKNHTYRMSNLSDVTEIDFDGKPSDEFWFAQIYDLELNDGLCFYGGSVFCVVFKNGKWSSKVFIRDSSPIKLEGFVDESPR